MSSEGVHARTRSSERLDVQNPGGALGSTSPPTTTTSGAATATATGGGGGSSATNKVVGATKASSSSSSSSMLQFSEHAINQVQGLSKRGLDLPITARLQRRRYRGIVCTSFVLFALFYVYVSAIVAAHNRHRKVIPYIGSETKHLGEGLVSRVFRKKRRGGTSDDIIHQQSPSSRNYHHDNREDMELELEDEDAARMFYHH